jgi:hypothetical protein
MTEQGVKISGAARGLMKDGTIGTVKTLELVDVIAA